MPATLPCSKAGGVGRADHAGDVDDRVGIGDQPFERVAVVEAAGDPQDAVALRLLAAGQGLDLVAGGERGVDQVRADEAGAAGDRELHSGDQGFAGFARPRALASCRTSARLLDDRVEQRLDALAERRGDRTDGFDPAAFSSAAATLPSRLSSSRSALVSATISGLSLEAGAVSGELVADDAIGFGGIVAPRRRPGGAAAACARHGRGSGRRPRRPRPRPRSGRGCRRGRTRGPCGGPRRAAGGAW